MANILEMTAGLAALGLAGFSFVCFADMSRPPSLYQAAMNHCHVPQDAAASCSFIEQPADGKYRSITESQLSVEIAKMRTNGRTGADLDELAGSNGGCLKDRETAFCVDDALDAADKNAIKKALKPAI